MLYIDFPLFMGVHVFSVSSFYLVSQKELFSKNMVTGRFLYLPFLMALGIGLTVTNTRASAGKR